MSRRFYAALACVLSLVIVAGPVAAHDFTGSEEVQCGTRKAPRTCYTNNVKCAKGQKADAAGVKVYQTGSPTSAKGGIGVCNDGKGALGSRVPIQGRAVAQGSTSGGSVYADGDRNNQGQAAGWARIDGTFGPSAPKVRCGDDKGRRDATHPTSADTQADCGA